MYILHACLSPDYDLQIFVPFSGLSAHFFFFCDRVLCRSKIYDFDEVQSTYFSFVDYALKKVKFAFLLNFLQTCLFLLPFPLEHLACHVSLTVSAGLSHQFQVPLELQLLIKHLTSSSVKINSLSYFLL